MTPTVCRNCDNVHDRRRHPRAWLCIKFPRIEGTNFVDPETWVENEPYMFCRGINGGACPMFTPMRTEDDNA